MIKFIINFFYFYPNDLSQDMRVNRKAHFLNYSRYDTFNYLKSLTDSISSFVS